MSEYSKSDHIRDVYANYGLAMYMAQVLEHELVNGMVTVNRANGRITTLSELDQFMELRFEKRTLGTLINEMRDHIAVDPELDSLLSSTLKTRNWLAHAYFRERGDGDFYTRPGKDRMIAELQRARDMFVEADRMLSEATRSLRESLGLTDDVIEAELKNLVQTARGESND